MATSALEFVPSQGELSVVGAILEYGRSHFGSSSSLDGSAQIDSDNAVEILQRSGLPNEDLANIWTLADEDGDGHLSERELAIAVRLIGWAQSGKPVNRSFVNYSNGPLPMLKDIWNNQWDDGPEPVQLPPVNVADKIEFNRTFREAGPVNGLLDGEKVRDIYLKTNLSFSDLDRIWHLIDTEQRGSLNNIEFAVGMYLIQAVKTCQLTTLPSSIPSHVFDQFAPKAHSPFATPRVPPKSAPLPWKSPPIAVKTNVSSPSRSNTEDWDVSIIEQAEARGHFETLDAEQKGMIDGDESARFMLKFFKLSRIDIAEIWDLVDLRRDNQFNQDQLAVAVHLIHKKLEGHETPRLELPASLVPPSMRPKSPNHTRRASAPPPVPPKRAPPPIPSASRKPSLSVSSPSTSTSPTLKRATSFSPTSTLRPPKASKPQVLNRFSIAAIHEAPSPVSNKPPSFPVPQIHYTPPPVPSIPSIPEASTYYARPPVPRSPNRDEHIRLPSSPSFSSPSAPSPANHSNNSSNSLDQETLAELRAEREESKRLRRQLEELMDQLKGQNRYREQNETLKGDNKRLKKRLAEMEQAINQVMAANEGADRTDELTGEVTRLTQLLADHEHTEEELRKTLESLAEFTQENTLLKQKHEDLKVEKGSLERELSDVGNQLQNIQGEKNSIATRLAEMEKLLADPQAKGSSRRELQMLLKDVTKENEELKSREREMQAQMSTLLLTSQNHFQMDELKRENSGLKLQIGELEELMRGMQASNSDNVLRRRISELEREKEMLNAQIGEMTRRVTGIEELSERRMQELRTRVRELEATNSGLRHQQASLSPSHDDNAPPPAYEELSATR
ncbi:hypothetical protein NP233_g5819 [Leucocoprinus birnbaumii]|uniref:Uncharacterized protein n=1 Tax=Leucocoprinus birnbaumii TaxID=56174 RepID=A0AAD5YQK4_9AGAR|nr:hypothetical protein NP233_g5819 [Leucocoprinus birnbaumii]